MDFDLLRKDEIWFAGGGGKNCEGSRLYPLDAFREAKTETSVDKRYWEGGYGGIPVLSDSYLGGDADASAE